MDSLITAAARALAAGDPLGALKRVALRDDPAALALRGTAMAQLGDLSRARGLLRQAARAYGPREVLARARCTVAEIEIAFAARDLNWSSASLDAARAVLETHGDESNAARARYLEIKRLLMIGRLDDAERALGILDATAVPPPLQATHELVVAGIAVRRVQAKKARAALVRAAHAAHSSGIPALAAEVEAASHVLAAPAARLITRGAVLNLRLEQVEALLESDVLVVDASRFRIRDAGHTIELARRPVLFTLARLLAEAWPGDVPRAALVARLFRAKRVDESYRARLRVEVGRLRSLLRTLVQVIATPDGFSMVPRRAREVVVLARTQEEDHAEVLALLADGESWSSSALALALDVSPRTTQRALETLAAAGKAQPIGRGRARRWVSPTWPGFATTLLLTEALTND